MKRIMVLFPFLFCLALTNLLCNGQFQNYKTYLDVFGKLYAFGIWTYYEPTAQQCWYNLDGGQIQMRNNLYYYTTIGIQLISTVPYTVCQKVQLEENKKYRIQVDVFSNYVSEAQLTVTINNITVMKQIFIDTNKFFKIKNFTTIENSNSQICFDQTSIIPVGKSRNIGIMIDNITLQQVRKIQIEYFVQVSEIQSQLKIKTNTVYEQGIVNELKNRYEICDNQMDIENWTAIKDQQDKLIIQVFPDYNTVIKQLHFKLVENDNSQNNQLIEFTFNMTGASQQYFIKLHETNKQIVKYLSQFSQVIQWFIANFITIIKVSFCSYFIFSILGFWNISLLYIFLLIPIMPEFTKIIYYDLLENMLIEADFIVWLSKYVEIPQWILSIGSNIQFGEAMDQYQNGQRWFGSFGLSTHFIKNNLNSFLLLVLLSVKVILVKFVDQQILQKRMKIIIISKTKTIDIFAGQVTSMAPTFIVSAIISIRNSGTQSLYKMTNNIIQVVILFLVIVCMLVHIYREYRKENPDKVQKQFIPKFTKQALSIGLIYFAPFLLALGSQAEFLVVTSILIYGQAYLYTKRCKYINKFNKVFELLMNVVWVVHHTSFMILYLVSPQRTLEYKQIPSQIVVVGTILGTVVICTVILGSIIQFTKNVLQVIAAIFMFIKKCCKIQTKIMPSSQQQRQSKSDKSQVQVVNTTIVVEQIGKDALGWQNDQISYQKLIYNKQISGCKNMNTDNTHKIHKNESKKIKKRQQKIKKNQKHFQEANQNTSQPKLHNNSKQRQSAIGHNYAKSFIIKSLSEQQVVNFDIDYRCMPASHRHKK